MKKNWKQGVAVCLASTMVVSLAACGKAEKPSQTEIPNAQESTKVETQVQTTGNEVETQKPEQTEEIRETLGDESSENETLENETSEEETWEEETVGDDNYEDYYDEEWNIPLQIGTSSYIIYIPESYQKGELTEDDIADGQIAYFYSENSLVDFDIYQFPKEEENASSLFEYYQQEATEYHAEEISDEPMLVLDDLELYWYRAKEEFDGKTYTTETYLFEEGDDYFEIVFWLDGDEWEASMQVFSMICSVEKIEEYTGFIALEDTFLYILAPGYFPAGNDGSEDLIASYKSFGSEMGFDLYVWNAEGQSLADYAAEEAREKELTITEYNGVEVYSYLDEEESYGQIYKTKTCIMKNVGQLVELVFWLDGENSEEEAELILNTLQNYWEDTFILGYSYLSVTAPGYYLGEIDDSEDLIEYYKSDESSLDFDVYQWKRENRETLADYAEKEADGKEVTVSEYNGITVCSYHDVEEDDGKKYDTWTCIMQDGGDFVEIVFWLDGENAQEEAEVILNTLYSRYTGKIYLGASYLTITAFGYYEGERDDSDDLIGYYMSDDSDVDFDLYAWTDYDTDLESYAKEEADGKELTKLVVNGIDVYCYYDVEEDEGQEYSTWTCIAQSIYDDSEFVEIVFWLDGEDAQTQAEEILNTLVQEA